MKRDFSPRAQQGHAKSWTLRYQYGTLFALNQMNGPSGLPEIYRKVGGDLNGEGLLEEGEDLEWRVRWALSNAQKKSFTKNTAVGEGEWEITSAGRFWVTSDPIDDIDETEIG